MQIDLTEFFKYRFVFLLINASILRGMLGVRNEKTEKNKKTKDEL